MKLLGLIGGTGWVSTVEYYRLLNQETNRRMGGMNAARCILYSLNYADIHAFNQKGNLLGTYFLLREAALKLQQAGVDGLLLCANTLHMFADDLQKEIHPPLIHIASATAEAITKQGLTTVGLLGTKPTMEQDFYKNRLSQNKIRTIVPSTEDREFIHQTIMHELLQEVFLDSSKKYFLKIIRKLTDQGAQGIVLGCTEIPLLIKKDDLDMPLFNTLEIHSTAAVDFALRK